MVQLDSMKEFIERTIKDRNEVSTKSTHMYAKSYTTSIDILKMYAIYQHHKLQQLECKGNLKQHVALFVRTSNNPGTDEDYLVKMFVRSLKGNVFDWCTNIEPNSIDY
uniref:Uncharacterized protein n=1 Tax=Solanum tuberosum TaxID=4113 RepID=M1DT86_SOLTU